MPNVYAAENFGLDIQLRVAFSEMGMGEFVEARVSDALVLAEMSRGRFYVSQEARDWVREIGEKWRSKWRLTRVILRLFTRSVLWDSWW